MIDLYSHAVEDKVIKRTEQNSQWGTKEYQLTPEFLITNLTPVIFAKMKAAAASMGFLTSIYKMRRHA